MKSNLTTSAPFPAFFRHWKIPTFFLLVGILLHIPLFWPSSFDKDIISKSPAVTESVYLVLEPPQPALTAKHWTWDDPTLYLLPSDLGFSARIRNFFSEFHPSASPPTPSILLQPFIPQKWEGQKDKRSLETMMISSPEISLESVASSVLPIESLPAEEGSAWRVSGAIAERLAATPSTLPAIQSTELLAPTVLHVGITPEGQVRFVVLDKSSGLEKADEAAIRFSRTIRFIPAPPGNNDLVWGDVRVLWRVDRLTRKS